MCDLVAHLGRKPEAPLIHTGRYRWRARRVIAVAMCLGFLLVPGRAQTPATYVGSEVCVACHEVVANQFKKGAHFSIEEDKKGYWAGKACEACHGPGSKHAETAAVEDIRNPIKLANAEADKVCFKCHLNQSTFSGRLRASHFKNMVPCTVCHKIHATPPATTAALPAKAADSSASVGIRSVAAAGSESLVARRIASINELCVKCHVNVLAQFQRPFHHRVPENAMSCIDCHNPHGTLQVRMTQVFAANEPGCLNCHGDKRGPFTYEHPPMRLQGCGACHELHGSQNPRMLTRQAVVFVCMECHSNIPSAPNTGGVIGALPPPFHNLNSPRFQNCTICHQKIHGSYVDRNFLR
jgi:DmsE family decaheme c-type cytochrome